MQSLVCEACWDDVFNTEAIQKFWIQESYNFSYTTTWARIVRSAESACNWCTLLKSILPSPNTTQWPNTWTPVTELLVVVGQAYLMPNASPPGLNLLEIEFCSEGLSHNWHNELNLFVDDTDSSAGIVTARPLESKVDSSKAYLQIRRWLEQCKDHVDCGGVQFFADLPSRVIEVAPVDSGVVPRIRSTKGLEGSYLALSYCWGSDQPYVLTTKNVEVLTIGLDTSMLPQTILDAIKVTTNLGIKYLWVDALCIMQDSAEEAARHDMNQELAKMDQVYKNAIMTIVAACVPSVKGGFLQDRPGSKQSCFDIPCRLSPQQFFVVHIQEHNMVDDTKEPINSRAWTFQEQILSPRLLIYASHTLQWQCRTLTCNLGGSYHSPRPSAAPRLPSTQTLLSNGPEQKEESHDVNPNIPHPILQHWLQIVTIYSARKFSLPSDKLPALSALAVSYAPVFGPEYHAGIWARSAVQQLCWRSPNNRQFFTRPTHYRAPSWSWAALDGPVYFPSFLEIGNGGSICVPYQHFQIVEWQTRPKAASVLFGEVTEGKLVITTVVRAATFDPTSSPTVRFDDVSDVSQHDVSAAPTLAGTELRQTAQGTSDTAEDNFTRSVRCLAMYRNVGFNSSLLGGLMLVEADEHDQLFRRIGSYSADVSAFQDYPLDIVHII